MNQPTSYAYACSQHGGYGRHSHLCPKCYEELLRDRQRLEAILDNRWIVLQCDGDLPQWVVMRTDFDGHPVEPVAHGQLREAAIDAAIAAKDYEEGKSDHDEDQAEVYEHELYLAEARANEELSGLDEDVAAKEQNNG